MAILLNALAPSISHALDSFGGRSAAWVEICSLDGNRLVALAADHASAAGDPGDQPQAKATQHCPFCASHAGNFALPTPSMAAQPANTGAAVVPLLFYRAPQPLFAWAAANPRAPPAAL
ncbi:MAG TPA: DUF2946 domain-containing protein [Burkholderiaceae bacterium]|nr:DUF2946 domain-containing protein [Burkholderiaceae bacterium]